MGAFEKDIRDGKIPGFSIDPDNPWIEREEVPLDAAPGTRIKFHGEGGWDGGLSARAVLHVGKTYTLKEMRVGDWESQLSVEEAEGWFNTVHFEMER